MLQKWLRNLLIAGAVAWFLALLTANYYLSGRDWFGRLLVAAVVGLFLAACYLVEKPLTGLGRIALRLCVVNAIGWFILLPLSDRGHPPPFLFPFFGFWLLNLILLPAIVVVLWMCRRDGLERKSYLVIAFTYAALNIIVLFVVPAIGVVVNH